MRKGRTRMLSLALVFGLMISQTPGTRATAFAAEESGTSDAVIAQELPEEADAADSQDYAAETDEAGESYASEPEEDPDSEEVSEAEEPEQDTSETEESSEEPDTGAAGGEDEAEDTSVGNPDAEAPEAAEEAAETAGDAEEMLGELGLIQYASQQTAAETAVASSGWVQDGSSWYYYLNGEAVTGWQNINKKYYYFTSSGVMVTGFRTLDGATYYFQESGAAEGVMAIGWKKIGGYWYFFPSGKMTTGWRTISGEKYYFNSNGQMQTEQWIGDLWLRDDGTATDEVFSKEYMGTEYYSKLQQALKDLEDEPDIMKRVLKIAQTQEGYKNYATSGVSIESARENGYLWTGAVKRNNGIGTGNSEYTRWAQRYVTRRAVSQQYEDMHWCAIFSSWCLYQAGMYYGQEKKSWYYSYNADPRVERSSMILTSFNCDQAQVWYTPLATNKIAKYAGWNTYVHTEVDPYDVPYRPGGLIFFCWEGDGVYFDHVGIVVSYDEKNHILRYISGNCSGQVLTYDVYYDKKTSNGVLGRNTIMAYAEYYEGREAWKAEDGMIRYYRNGKYLTGWQEIDGRTYYFTDEGRRVIGFVKVGDSWYYMNSAGVKTTGWVEEDGKRYYLNEKGVMLTGKQEIDGRTYYFSPSGFQYKDGWWKGYEYDEDGYLVSDTKASWRKAKMGWWYGESNGWYAKDTTLKINGEEYKFDRSGYWIDPSRKIGWVTENGEQFYYPEEGKKATGWRKIEGQWFYFGKDGYMRKNGWWQGYYIGTDGVCTATVRATWRKAKLGWWFGDSTGWYAEDEVIRINDTLYEFDEMGYLVED